MEIELVCPKCGNPIENFTRVRDEFSFTRLKTICPVCGAKYRISINKDFGNSPIYSDVSNGYDKKGYDEDGYDKNGYDFNGFDRKHIHKHTHTPYDVDGYDFEGYNKDGYSYTGVNRSGISMDDFEKYDKDGFNKNG